MWHSWKKIITNNPYLILHVLNLFVIIFIVIPFFSNPMYQRDMAGHVFASEFTKDFLLPEFRGWNPFHNLGYPIGSYYPFLIHYLTGILSTIVLSSSDWLKIFIITALLLLPYSIFVFIRKLDKFLLVNRNKGSIKDHNVLNLRNLDTNKHLFITLVTYFLVLASPSTFGGSLQGAFVIGLITNFIALPLVFFYLSSILNFVTTNQYIVANRNDKIVTYKKNNHKKRRWNLKILFLSLFLTIIMLSHSVSMFIVVSFTGVLALKEFYLFLKNRLFDNFKVAWVLILAVFNSLFFYIPYFLSTEYLTDTKPLSVDLAFTTGLIFLFCFSIFLFFTFFKYNKPQSYVSYIAFIGLILIFPVVEICFRLLGLNQTLGIIHAYRLLPYIMYLLTPLVLLQIVNVLIISKYDSKKISILETRWIKFFKLQKLDIVHAAYILVLTIFILNTFLIITKDFLQRGYQIENFDYSQFSDDLGSNFLNIYSFGNIYDFNKIPTYETIRGTYNNYSLQNQFEESSYLNSFVISLIKSIDRQFYSQYEYTNEYKYIENIVIPNTKVDLASNIFNFRYIVFSDSNDPSLCKSDPIHLGNFMARTIENKVLVWKSKSLYICEYNTSSNGDDYDVEKILHITNMLEKVDNQRWDYEVKKWWIEDKKSLVISEEYPGISGDISLQENSSNASYDSIGTNIDWASDFQSFSFTLPKQKDIQNDLYLVKIQYNPRWNAYKMVDGKKQKLPIYRVSPSLMAVETSGKTYFEYKFFIWEKFLLLISTICIFLNFVFLLKNKYLPKHRS